ncbi:IS1634 family transposase [Chloroflexota bacterium]
MDEKLTITSEQINDVPLLLGIMADMNIQDLIDEQVQPHGAWQGISVGTLVMIWLSYMLTEQDHRMVMVREWVEARQQTFNELLGVNLRDTDCTDDRLANVLSMLGDPDTQAALDQSMLQRWVSVYELPTKTMRLDSTSASVYHKMKDPMSLLQLGHSKDHRPDLAQFKIMLATLDPLGLPITCQVVGGQRADDGLYVPAYDAACTVLGHSNVLVVGDSKMGSMSTRGHLVAQGSTYLCSYNPVGSRAERASWVEAALARSEHWQRVEQTDEVTGEVHLSALLDEWSREQKWTDPHGQVWTWTERVLVVRSEAMQAGLTRKRQQALSSLCEKLTRFQRPPGRGRKRYRSEADLRAQIDKLLADSGFEHLLQVELALETLPDGSERWIVASFALDWRAWQALVARLGWQVLVTNTTAQHYTAQALVQAYRQQIIPEYAFSRLKSRYLNIRPLYIRDEQRIVGLTWLLMLALRVLTLTEYRLRTALAQHNEALVGLNPASRTQSTRRPTTERVLQAFQNITLTVLHDVHPQRHVPPLSNTQRHVLELLQLPLDLYSRLATRLPKPLLNLRE